jgi:REP element-mobilizing transposase RayT
MPYTAANLPLPSSLVYAWTGWPREGSAFAGALPADARDALAADWKADGLVLRSFALGERQAQAAFDADPAVSPVFCAARAKGRLQHALRRAGLPCAFSRKAAVRALGHNLTPTVTRYVRDQLRHVDLADPKYRARLTANAHEDRSVDLDQPVELNRSRYWYNLHLVMVTAGRYRMGGAEFLPRLREAMLAAARAQGCACRAVALMPDHVHLALRGHPERSPREIGLALQNESARAAMCRFWQDAFYVGTFSAYDLRAFG